MTVMLIWNYELVRLERFDYQPDTRYQGRIETATHTFVKFMGKWEAYRVTQTGRRRGAEMFIGYVEEPEQLAVLEAVRRSARNERAPDGHVLAWDHAAQRVVWRAA